MQILKSKLSIMGLLPGYANSDKVLPIYIGDDQTDEDAFKVNIINI